MTDFMMLQAALGDIWKGRITTSEVFYGSFKEKNGESDENLTGNSNCHLSASSNFINRLASLVHLPCTLGVLFLFWHI